MTERSGGEEAIAAIVGLGNPGRQYELTRHNVGFMVVDRLAAAAGISMQERKFPAAWGSGLVRGSKILLIKPTTYMNRSGEAVGPLLKYFEIPPAGMLVIHDDLDLPCGRLRIVRGGGTGGHRGVTSIKQHTGGADFPRLKLGIGRPQRNEPVEAYVLQTPYFDQEESFSGMIVQALEVVEAVLDTGLEAAMNHFNRREPRRKEEPQE
jgi:PTH1 family peptidyl-tRNA hydrolase